MQIGEYNIVLRRDFYVSKTYTEIGQIRYGFINSGIFIFTCDGDGGCEIHSWANDAAKKIWSFLGIPFLKCNIADRTCINSRRVDWFIYCDRLSYLYLFRNNRIQTA